MIWKGEIQTLTEQMQAEAAERAAIADGSELQQKRIADFKGKIGKLAELLRFEADQRGAIAAFAPLCSRPQCL